MDRDETIERLNEAKGAPHAEEASANLARDTPQEPFRWPLTAPMPSARIDTSVAVASSMALRERDRRRIDVIPGEASRDDLVETPTSGGYARYREETATYTQGAAELVRDRYGDDLRRLRDEAGDGEAILEALQDAKGIGSQGAGIFAREAQLAWDRPHPMPGDPAAEAARALGLPPAARGSSEALPDRKRYARLATVMARASIEGMPEGLG